MAPPGCGAINHIFLRTRACIRRKKGESTHEIAKALDVRQSVIYDWLRKVHTDGISGLDDKKSPGAKAKPRLPGLNLRVDNGSQYTSGDFKASIKSLGISLEYTHVNTPEQNGHMESFHHTLKKEYLWPHEFANIREAEEVLALAFEDTPGEDPLVPGVHDTVRIRGVLGAGRRRL